MSRPDPHAVSPDVSLLAELIARAASTGAPPVAGPVAVGKLWRLEEDTVDGHLYATNVSMGIRIKLA